MKHKFSLIWRVAVALVLVLSFSLVAAVPVAGDVLTDDVKFITPDNTTLDIDSLEDGGDFYIKMDDNNSYYSVDAGVADTADIKVKIYDGQDVAVTGATWSDTPVDSVTFTATETGVNSKVYITEKLNTSDLPDVKPGYKLLAMDVEGDKTEDDVFIRAEVSFDKAYYYLNETMTMRVEDDSVNSDPNTKQKLSDLGTIGTHYDLYWDTGSPAQVAVIFEETGNDTGVFEATVTPENASFAYGTGQEMELFYGNATYDTTTGLTDHGGSGTTDVLATASTNMTTDSSIKWDQGTYAVSDVEAGDTTTVYVTDKEYAGGSITGPEVVVVENTETGETVSYDGSDLGSFSSIGASPEGTATVTVTFGSDTGELPAPSAGEGLKATYTDPNDSADTSFATAAIGSTVTVYDDDGTTVKSTHTTIEGAIDDGNTDSGDVIVVADNYNSADENFPITVSKSVTIQSVSGAASTIIDGSAITGTPRIVLDVTASGVTINGFAIIGSKYTTGMSEWGIYLRNTGFTVQNNTITDVGGESIFVDSMHNAITSGLIDNNILTGLGSDAIIGTNGIRVEEYGSNSISGVTLSNNIVSNYGEVAVGGREGNGIKIAEQGRGGTVSDITVKDNDISGCYSGLALLGKLTGMTGEKAIANNTISGCHTGVVVMSQGAVDCISVFALVNNTITNNTAEGIWFRDWSGVDITGAKTIKYNDISGNGTYGILNDFVAVTDAPDATNNWWGDATGPSAGTGTYASTATGSGDAVSKDVSYDPWLGAEVSAAKVVANATSLNAQTEVGVKVSGAAPTGDDNKADVIGAALYASNPVPDVTLPFTPIENGFFDVYVGIATAESWVDGDEVVLKFYDSAITSDSVVYIWDASDELWKECTIQGYRTAGGAHMLVKVHADADMDEPTTPTIEGLQYLPFAISTVPVVELESIAASPASVTLDVDGTQQLTVTATYSDASTAVVTASADCTYVSGVPAVATVTSPGGGLITAVAEGDAIITVSYTEGGITETDTVSVSVWDPWIYDTNDNGVMEIGEVLNAISGYFAEEITITQVLEVIALYF